ncbi:5323_t:CDS:2 [Ambispora gerdemannii]|uniref:RING-type E3 ubiquitin transferase n=1 Tax=Ambispora gerdemannii TaxID=144530 RepID=A0A9N9BLH9_9GLOM|nr:5323_t:CDS:2 [Ambispora gerdemannii]
MSNSEPTANATASPSPSSEALITSSQANTKTAKRPIPHFNISFPYAAQPDIIRANQKDVYYQRVLEEQITNIFRQFFGTRRQHQYQKEVVLISDSFYYCLTTLLGTQTLGEEYCDILQISESTGKFPIVQKRAWLIFWHVILPYLYNRGTVELRRLTKPTWREMADEKIGKTSNRTTLRKFVHKLLPKIQQFFTTHVHTFHLAIFYFFGAYYGFSKRITGIRYIFTRQLALHERRIGYEVLGFLLVIQLLIQSYQYQKVLQWVCHPKRFKRENVRFVSLLGQIQQPRDADIYFVGHASQSGVRISLNVHCVDSKTLLKIVLD